MLRAETCGAEHGWVFEPALLLSEAGMGKSRGSLRGYEFSNLLFFLGLIVVLGCGCGWVLYHYGTKNRQAVVIIEPGISEEHTTGDIAVFYLEGFNIVGTTRRYMGRLEIPVTDECGFIRSLFDQPGIEEITIQPQSIIVKKNGTVGWDKLSSPIRGIINDHLHFHY